MVNRRYAMTDDELKSAGLVPYCPCGSGHYREAEYDARGIFLTYLCEVCEEDKLGRYRPEVFDDSRYWVDEALDY
jgi:hypothetical protein